MDIGVNCSLPFGRPQSVGKAPNLRLQLDSLKVREVVTVIQQIPSSSDDIARTPIAWHSW